MPWVARLAPLSARQHDIDSVRSAVVSIGGLLVADRRWSTVAAPTGPYYRPWHLLTRSDTRRWNVRLGCDGASTRLRAKECTKWPSRTYRVSRKWGL
jgi:hypothetical protein